MILYVSIASIGHVGFTILYTVVIETFFIVNEKMVREYVSGLSLKPLRTLCTDLRLLSITKMDVIKQYLLHWIQKTSTALD